MSARREFTVPGVCAVSLSGCIRYVTMIPEGVGAAGVIWGEFAQKVFFFAEFSLLSYRLDSGLR